MMALEEKKTVLQEKFTQDITVLCVRYLSSWVHRKQDQDTEEVHHQIPAGLQEEGNIHKECLWMVQVKPSVDMPNLHYKKYHPSFLSRNRFKRAKECPE